MTVDLDNILSLTDRVQQAIDCGDWQLASDIEAQRRSELERFVAQSSRAANFAEALVAIEQRNHRLIGLVEHHKRRVVRDATMVSASHAAAAAYADAGS
jgi:hypothetical protein